MVDEATRQPPGTAAGCLFSCCNYMSGLLTDIVASSSSQSSLPKLKPSSNCAPRVANCVLFAAAPHHIEASCGLMTSTHHKILTHRLQMLHGIERSPRESERDCERMSKVKEVATASQN